MQRRLRWNIIAWMLFIHLGALVSLPVVNLSCLIALGILYPVTAIGVTLGYHRMISHKSFKTSKIVERILVTVAVLSVQGSPMEWVGLHRHHHLHSDFDRTYKCCNAFAGTTQGRSDPCSSDVAQ